MPYLATCEIDALTLPSALLLRCGAGCYYKQRGKLHAALHYLERTLKIEEAAATGAVENPASTHLNIAATLSTLGRHSAVRARLAFPGIRLSIPPKP